MSTMNTMNTIRFDNDCAHGSVADVGTLLWYDASEPSDMPRTFGLAVDELVSRVDDAFDDMRTDIEPAPMSVLMAWHDPFNDDFDHASSVHAMPLSYVRTTIVLRDNDTARGWRDSVESAFNLQCKRAIYYCKVPGDSF